jgi:hypothetical protein
LGAAGESAGACARKPVMLPIAAAINAAHNRKGFIS